MPIQPSPKTMQGRKARGPSQRVTEQALAATLALLVEEGGGSLKMEAISERSGIHKTTLYRRWGDVSELVKAAIASVDMEEAVFADTGALATDMLALSESFAEHFQKPTIIAINRLIVGSRSPGSQLAQWMDEYWAGRQDLYHIVVDRALARGEQIANERFHVAVEMIVGPMVLRTLMRGAPIDETLVTHLGRSAYEYLRA